MTQKDVPKIAKISKLETISSKSPSQLKMSRDTFCKEHLLGYSSINTWFIKPINICMIPYDTI